MLTKNTSVIPAVSFSPSHTLWNIDLKRATLISKMVEDMGDSSGVLGCMASDNTVLVIPSDINDIENIMTGLVNYLDMNCYLSGSHKN